MRKCLSSATAVCSVLCIASMSYAGGLFTMPGTTAQGMGGAFTAVANDMTAIYWNPAGLTQVKDKTISISSYYGVTVSKGNAPVNTSAPDIYDGDFPVPSFYDSLEPAVFSKGEVTAAAPMPFVATKTSINGTALGVGVYVISGGGGEWDDHIKSLDGMDDITASMSAMNAIIDYNVSVARQITPALSVGCGLDVLQMMDRTKFKKQYSVNSGSIADASSLPGYRLAVDQKAAGFGIQANAGILYRIRPDLQAGATYRSGSTITMNGLATVYASGLDPLTDVDTDFTEKYTYPATLSFGLSWNPFQALTIASGADYAAYSGSRRYFDYDTTSASLPDVDESADKIDVMVYHLGASYQYNPSWKFFMGIQTDPCPSERHKLMLMDVYQYNQTMTTLGAGYTWNMLDISALYYYNTADKPARGSRSYESSTNAFTLAFGYHFN